jgi:NAD(P)-dependent dehydrogenase (short-subunit alcohol dehydrogenase family)
VVRIFITGSTDGLGLASARTLIGQGHDVVLHARTHARVSALAEVADRSAGVLVGDLSSAAETRALADQVDRLGRMNVVIHNAGVYTTPTRAATPEGHASTLAVNLLAPYLLTALVQRPDRLVFVSSGMHRSAHEDLDDIDWTARRWNAIQAYCESKLHLTALSSALARRWDGVLSNAVDPGWVPTKMGGPAASDDLELGHRTQTWLAASDDPAALVSGRYWHHQRPVRPAPPVTDDAFQQRLMDKLAELTSVTLPS